MFNHIAVEMSNHVAAGRVLAPGRRRFTVLLLAGALLCVSPGWVANALAQPVDLCSPGLVQDGGTIATFAGSGAAGFDYGGFGGDGGPATDALLKFPTAAAVGQGSL